MLVEPCHTPERLADVWPCRTIVRMVFFCVMDAGAYTLGGVIGRDEGGRGERGEAERADSEDPKLVEANDFDVAVSGQPGAGRNFFDSPSRRGAREGALRLANRIPGSKADA